jgi:hypothetical protein
VLYSFYKNWVNNLTYVCFAFVTGEESTVCSGMTMQAQIAIMYAQVCQGMYLLRVVCTDLLPVCACWMAAAFSAQPLYTSGLIATFNLFWTSLPIIAYALFEQVIISCVTWYV